MIPNFEAVFDAYTAKKRYKFRSARASLNVIRIENMWVTIALKLQGKRTLIVQ